MLEIYKRDEFNGKLKVIKTFENFDGLFAAVPHHMNFAEVFGYTDTDRHNFGLPFGDHHPISEWNWWTFKTFAYIAYDNGKFVTPDCLVGLFRIYKRHNQHDWRKSWTRRYDAGMKKSAWGAMRHMKTTQEKRWEKAWDDEEFAPKYRASRCGHNLPSAWEDYWAHGSKSWKTQSKRNHQWKEKRDAG